MIESIADFAADLRRKGMGFEEAVEEALNEFSVNDPETRGSTYKEVCSCLGKRGALVKAAKARRFAEKIANAAASFLRSGRKFNDAVYAALDAFSVTNQRTRKSMYNKICPLLSKQVAEAKAKRKRLQQLAQQREFRFR
jgi:hypothetical protein